MPNDASSRPSDPSRPRRVVVAGVTVPDDGAHGAEDDAVLVRRARALRDAGVEVIWAGPGLRAEQVAAIAVSEDADGVEIAPAAATGDVTRALALLEVDDVEVVATAD